MSDQLPSYIATAKPNPQSNRAPWYKNTAPTYAGIFLWFVFWMGSTGASTPGGIFAHGIGVPLVSLALAALVCHLFYYVVLGIIGQKTGLPLYIAGTSTFGTHGGFALPGFLMGVLQFGWLGVNVYFSSLAILAIDPGVLAGSAVPFTAVIVMIAWGVLAALMGLLGIQYVAKVATFLPLIPLATLLVLFALTATGVRKFSGMTFTEQHQMFMMGAAKTAEAGKAAMAAPLTQFGVFEFVMTYVIGFFATAGAAGVDFGTNSRNERDVHLGGVVGIFGAIVFTAGLAMLIVAGAYGKTEIAKQAAAAGYPLDAFSFIKILLGAKLGNIVLIALAVAAFPAACFSAFIAANSFKTTLPGVNPFISVGIGTAVSILLAITKLAGQLAPVFALIGASFGPICGAMAVDYILNGCKWAGPRKGFNPAGWLAWAMGFIVGIMPNLGLQLPLAGFWAMVVGAVVYFIAAKAGLQSEKVAMPGAAKAVEPAETAAV